MSQIRTHFAKPILCLLHGYIGVGKTTLARRIEVERRFVRFTSDEWMTKLFGDDPPAEAFQKSFQRVVELQEEMCRATLLAGASVIVDWGLWQPEYRAKMRALAVECRATPWLVALACDDRTALTRVGLRNAGPMGSLVISDNTYKVLRDRFVPLGTEERADVVIDSAKTDLRRIDLANVLPAGSMI